MSAVTLSFDNGRDASSTPAVLDVPARAARATFFVLGRQLAKPDNLDRARRARAEVTLSKSFDDA